MKKTLGVILVFIGVIFVIISIIGLIKSFDLFSSLGSNSESISYIFGSILFPLILTVIGRGLIRKGFKFFRKKK